MIEVVVRTITLKRSILSSFTSLSYHLIIGFTCPAGPAALTSPSRAPIIPILYSLCGGFTGRALVLFPSAYARSFSITLAFRSFRCLRVARNLRNNSFASFNSFRSWLFVAKSCAYVKRKRGQVLKKLREKNGITFQSWDIPI